MKEVKTQSKNKLRGRTRGEPGMKALCPGERMEENNYIIYYIYVLNICFIYINIYDYISYI